jgi:hypothetical protein
MHEVTDADVRLVLQSIPPLFRPFFLGGLGLLVLGAGLLIGGPIAGQSTAGAGDAVPLIGVGAFLAVFGFFVTIVPMVGKMPYRKQIIVDRAAGQFVRRDRTLLRLRQVSYPLDEVRGVEVEAARQVDGDPYFTLLLRLRHGDSVTLDRFTDRAAAERDARRIRGHLGPRPPVDPDPPIPPPP